MIKPFNQGYLDSLCGIYSILNADKLVNNPLEEESQELFNLIIKHFSRKKILKYIIIEGTDHKTMSDLMNSVVGHRFPYKVSNKKSVLRLKDWWKISKDFLEEKENRAIILSLGGKLPHLTVVKRMNDRTIFLLDSNHRTSINRSLCRLTDYEGNDKHIIYPAQCWYLGKE